MTKEQIDSILDRVRTWPFDRQEEAASMLLMLEADDDLEEVTEELLEDLRNADGEVERGEFASDAEVRAVFDRYR